MSKLIKIVDKLQNTDSYKFILQNLLNDDKLTNDHKQKFEDYVENTYIDENESNVNFESKVNNDFLYRNISPVIAKKHNMYDSSDDVNIVRIVSKTRFYQCLKIDAESDFPHMFNSEEDFISSFELGTGELINRFGFINTKKELSKYKFGYKMMWSNLTDKDIKSIDEKDKKKLPCILGLDDKTIYESKYLIIHDSMSFR